MKNDIPFVFYNTGIHGGIKDFGIALYRELCKSSQRDSHYIELETSLNGLLKFLSRDITKKRGYCLHNIGFTSFGPSRILNFIHLLFVGISSYFGKKHILILHDSPEIFDKDVTFQPLNRFVLTATKLVTNLQRENRILVVSSRLKDLLCNRYNMDKVKYYPFPCSTFSPVKYSKDREVALIAFGHILPYKGFEFLVEVKKSSNITNFFCIGGKSSSVGKNSEYETYFSNLIDSFEQNKIRVTGYLPTERINELLSSKCPIAILPYKSISGSSSACIFFVERGIPIVSSKLDEFEILADHGAGIVLSDRDPLVFTDAITKIISMANWDKFRIKDQEYCFKYNFKNLADLIMSYT